MMEEVTFEQRHESIEGGGLFERRAIQAEGAAAGKARGSQHWVRDTVEKRQKQPGITVGWVCRIWSFILGVMKATGGSKAVE